MTPRTTRPSSQATTTTKKQSTTTTREVEKFDNFILQSTPETKTRFATALNESYYLFTIPVAATWDLDECAAKCKRTDKCKGFFAFDQAQLNKSDDNESQNTRVCVGLSQIRLPLVRNSKVLGYGYAKLKGTVTKTTTTTTTTTTATTTEAPTTAEANTTTEAVTTTEVPTTTSAENATTTAPENITTTTPTTEEATTTESPSTQSSSTTLTTSTSTTTASTSTSTSSQPFTGREILVSWGFDTDNANQTVALGDKVTWVWDQDQGENHNVVSGVVRPNLTTAPDGKFSSGAPSGFGTRFSVVFSNAAGLGVGTYPYFCVPHAATMRGQITVVPSSTTTTSSP